jgi:spore coat polysaccharide biosynthesis protein SpsF
MLSTLGVVEVAASDGQAWMRLGSRRRLGGKSLLEWVVRRVTESQRLSGVVVLLADGPHAAALSQVVPPDVPVLVSDRLDGLGRLAAALVKFPAESVVRLAPSTPFIDPGLIDGLVNQAISHPGCDYVGYCLRDGRLAIQSPLGLFAEWIKAKAIYRAHRDAPVAERDPVTRHLFAHPERYHLRFVTIPPELDREDMRLTLAVEDDWEHVQAIFDALGPEQLDWQRIVGLLDHQPALRRRMADLNRGRATATLG